MVEDKVGIKEYLGIKINYSNERNLDKFSLDTLKDRYLWENETHAQEAFARASVFGATYKGVTNFELAQRLYHYSSSCWFMFSTPILSNGGTSRGLPISCFLNYVPDSRVGLSDHYDENIWLASSGGGIGGYKMGAVGLLDNVPCLYAPLFQNYIYNDDGSSSFSPSISELNCHTLEAEIGFIIGKDLPPKKEELESGQEEQDAVYTEDEIISAIESVVCCVELVGSRAIGDAWKEMTLKSKLADCVMAGGVLMGEKLTPTETTTFTSDSIRKINTSFIVDGKVQDEGCADLCPQGGPIESLTWLVHTLNSKSCGLKKGQLVISGMTSKIGSPNAGNVIEVTFDTNNGDPTSSIQFSFKK